MTAAAFEYRRSGCTVAKRLLVGQQPAVLESANLRGRDRGSREGGVVQARGHPGRVMPIKVTVKHWHAAAAWTWNAGDDVCGICRMPFDGCPPGSKFPGDDSPVVWGTCGHAFHLQCISKWLQSDTDQVSWTLLKSRAALTAHPFLLCAFAAMPDLPRANQFAPLAQPSS